MACVAVWIVLCWCDRMNVVCETLMMHEALLMLMAKALIVPSLAFSRLFLARR